MEIEVKGIDSLRDKLKKLPQILNQATNQAMFEVTEVVFMQSLIMKMGR